MIAPNEPSSGSRAESAGDRWPARAVVLSPRAVKKLGRLGRDDRRRIADALARFAATGQGDVRKLTDVGPPVYRLRAGDYRTLFVLSPDRIEVERIANRREAY